MSAIRSSDRWVAASGDLAIRDSWGLTGGWLPDAVAGSEAVEHRVDRRPRVAGTGREAQHHGEEALGAESLEPELAGRAHGRCPAALLQQGDLPESLSRTQRG